MLEAAEIPGSLTSFYRAIYGEVSGYVYLATKSTKPQVKSWKQEFYRWPDEADKFATRIQELTGKYEVYHGCAVYKTAESADKDNVLGSNCFWVEFDGNVPNGLGDIPEPTIRVQSSSPNHQHWYWLTEEFLGDIVELERVNRTLAYAFSADASGWDATQVLRPPGTTNHKRGKQTELIYSGDSRFTGNEFGGLQEPPILVEEPIPDDLPAVDEVIFKYKFKSKVQKLFRKGPDDGDRSDGLMSLGYYLAEMGLRNEEILSLLLNADGRWGKFSGRTDQLRRLMTIVSIARAKYPLAVEESTSDKFKIYGLLDLLNTEVKLEWVWEGLLQEAGYMLLSGAPKVGKTQLSLSFAQAAILGQEFLGRQVVGEKKIGVLSLEMNLVDLKYFLEAQANNYSQEQIATLQERLRIMPLGEPHYLSKEQEQAIIEDWIHDEQLDGLIIDSLGSTTAGELGAEEAKLIMDWNDRVRQRYGCFTWWVHHHRKASGDNKKPNKLDDIYGSRYISARCTSAVCLWETSVKDAIQVLPLAVRLAKKPEPFYIKRTDNLHFGLLDTSKSIKKKDDEGSELGNAGFTTPNPVAHSF